MHLTDTLHVSHTMCSDTTTHAPNYMHVHEYSRCPSPIRNQNTHNWGKKKKNHTHTHTDTPPPIFMLILLVNMSRPLSPGGRSRVGCLFLSSSILPHSHPSPSVLFFRTLFCPSFLLCVTPFTYFAGIGMHTTFLCPQPLYYSSPSQPLLPSAPSGVSAACRSCCYGDRSYLHSVPLASPAPGAPRENKKM